MKRALPWVALALFGAALALSLLLILAGVSLRSKRHEASVPSRVSPRVLTIRNFLSDVYAAKVGERVIVFDAGMDPEGHALELLLDALGSELDAVSDIFLTHGHFDHVAAARRCPRARVHIGAGDADLLAHRVAARSIVPRLFGELLGVPPVEATHQLVGSETIELAGGQSVLAVPLPGHTVGSYVYVFDGVLFAGDALYLSRRGLALVEPDERSLHEASCRGAEELGELARRGELRRICTGHRGCAPPHEASSVLARLTAAAANRCARR